MSSQVTNAVGNWKIVDYPKHPECVGVQIKISHDEKTPNLYELSAHVVNDLRSSLAYNYTAKKWDPQNFSSTETRGSPEQIEKEGFITVLICGVQKLQIQDGKSLIIQTLKNEEARLERSY